MSMLAFSCRVMITWEAVLLWVIMTLLSVKSEQQKLTGDCSLFVISFANGGFAGSIYGFLFTWLGTLSVFATVGELASMCVDLSICSLRRCLIMGVQAADCRRPIRLGF